MIYSRYANPQFMLDMNAEDGTQMITRMYEKHYEEKAYKLYLSVRPNMTEKTYQTFEEFYQPQKKQEVVEIKSAEEILKEVREMMDSHSVGGEK